MTLSFLPFAKLWHMLLLADRQTQGLGLDDITGKVLLTSSLTTSQNQTAFVSKTKKLTAAHAPVNSNSLHRHRRERERERERGRERERERERGGRTDGHTDRKTDRQTCSHSTVHWQILAANARSPAVARVEGQADRSPFNFH